MYINTKEVLDTAINKFQMKIKSWISFLIETDPYIFYKIAIMALLLVILVLLLKKDNRNTRSTEISKKPNIPNSIGRLGGYKNFKGDTWFPTGWMWDEKNKAWKAPDYQTPPNKRPDGNVAPSGWHWNEIECIWEPPDIVDKDTNERWRWDNTRGIWVNLSKEEE